jgi:pimeloyl-ACP methyl ester carboxylesterase
MRSAEMFVALLLMLVSAGCATPDRDARGETGKPVDSLARAQQSDTDWNAPWTDSSSHKVGFVNVGQGVRLHYLDWGGSGPTIVLLTGFGLSAHIYDDLAPKLTKQFHVVALTRRGHGESDHPDSGYGIDVAVEDIRHFIDHLGISKAMLVGHSHGGWEIARFAARYPDRTLRLVFLDGTLDAKTHATMESHEPVKRPEADYSTPATARAWFTRYFYGRWTPALEADMRHYAVDASKWDENTADWIRKPADYAAIQAPSLAIYEFATVRSRYFWLDTIADRPRTAAVRTYLTDWLNPWQRRGVESFVRTIPNGRTLRLEGSHYLFITNESEVVDAMRSFLLAPDADVRECKTSDALLRPASCTAD